MDCTNPNIIPYIISFFLGVAGSLIASVLFLKWMKKYEMPNIQFSRKISKQKQDSTGCGFVYRIKFYNVGKITLSKVTAFAGVYFPMEYRRLGSKGKFGLLIPIRGEWWNVPPNPKKAKGQGYGRIAVLNLDDETFRMEILRYNFPNDIKAMAGSKKLDLETILEYASSFEVGVYAANTIGWTRVVSQNYESKDITPGEFSGLDVI